MRCERCHGRGIAKHKSRSRKCPHTMKAVNNGQLICCDCGFVLSESCPDCTGSGMLQEQSSSYAPWGRPLSVPVEVSVGRVLK